MMGYDRGCFLVFHFSGLSLIFLPPLYFLRRRGFMTDSVLYHSGCIYFPLELNFLIHACTLLMLTSVKPLGVIWHQPVNDSRAWKFHDTSTSADLALFLLARECFLLHTV
ncbi:hypothetical protein BGX38DRAFT_1221012, partial [Terfezia claveryi]